MEIVTLDTGEQIEITHGSGNVFADLGFPDAEEHMMKARLVMEIDRLRRERRMTQAQLAELAGIDQPKVSKLLRGQFREYTIDRLVRIVTRLGSRVELKITPGPGPGAVRKSRTRQSREKPLIKA